MICRLAARSRPRFGASWNNQSDGHSRRESPSFQKCENDICLLNRPSLAHRKYHLALAVRPRSFSASGLVLLTASGLLFRHIAR
jgi:hypothetical protein